MDNLTIAGRQFDSRLSRVPANTEVLPKSARCHQASGAEVVTVAVRRVNLTDKSKESLLDHIDRSKFFILPNTAACYTADEAIRTARLGRVRGGAVALGKAGGDWGPEDAVPRQPGD